ncbi:MAG: zf-HC2 domain-containing protein [Candidatus Hydrogenedentes bacterium]|nr:zf-HC2 domain-containing protein [Candidatus Hydrogenedentota bacterium]
MNCPTLDTLIQLAFSTRSGNGLTMEERAVQEHVQACGACGNAWAEWNGLLAETRILLAERRPRETCPEENLFAEYLDGVLSSAARRRFERHLAACGRCIDQLVETYGLIPARETAAPARIAVQWLKDGLKVLSLAKDILRPLELHPAPVLGATSPPAPHVAGASSPVPSLPPDSRLQTPDSKTLAWQMTQDGYDIQLTLQHAKAQRTTLHLAVLRDAAPVHGHRVSLRGETTLRESRKLAPTGTVTFAGLDPAEYEVSIDVPERPIVVCLGVAGND